MSMHPRLGGGGGGGGPDPPGPPPPLRQPLTGACGRVPVGNGIAFIVMLRNPHSKEDGCCQTWPASVDFSTDMDICITFILGKSN